MSHKLEMKLTETSTHFGSSEIVFSTTHASNLNEMVDAFNTFLKAAGYCNEVDVKEVDDACT